jgi:hypothetical protein
LRFISSPSIRFRRSSFWAWVLRANTSPGSSKLDTVGGLDDLIGGGGGGNVIPMGRGLLCGMTTVDAEEA